MDSEDYVVFVPARWVDALTDQGPRKEATNSHDGAAGETGPAPENERNGSAPPADSAGGEAAFSKGIAGAEPQAGHADCPEVAAARRALAWLDGADDIMGPFAVWVRHARVLLNELDDTEARLARQEGTPARLEEWRVELAGVLEEPSTLTFGQLLTQVRWRMEDLEALRTELRAAAGFAREAPLDDVLREIESRRLRSAELRAAAGLPPQASLDDVIATVRSTRRAEASWRDAERRDGSRRIRDELRELALDAAAALGRRVSR